MKHWIQAARLRTLPLSLSGILMGAFLAQSKDSFNWEIFIFSLLTTIAFQILSNFANDYGDGIKGTDSSKIGEQRAVASGTISIKQMKKAIILTGILSFIFTIILLYISFLPFFLTEFYIFIALGIACILAAILYTIGKKPYGYLGFGDIFVFIFFGLIGVCGSEFLYTKSFDLFTILPAAAIGFFSVAVLNLNNMRDMKNDKIAGKFTLALYLGIAKSKVYQLIIMFLPFVLCLIYVLKLYPNQYKTLAFMLLLIPINAYGRRILEIDKSEEFDPYLKKVALICLFFTLLFGMGIIDFNFNEIFK